MSLADRETREDSTCSPNYIPSYMSSYKSAKESRNLSGSKNPIDSELQQHFVKKLKVELKKELLKKKRTSDTTDESDDLTAVMWVGKTRAKKLAKIGYNTYEDLAEAKPETVAEELYITEEKAEDIILSARGVSTFDDSSIDEITNDDSEFSVEKVHERYVRGEISELELERQLEIALTRGSDTDSVSEEESDSTTLEIATQKSIR